MKSIARAGRVAEGQLEGRGVGRSINGGGTDTDGGCVEGVNTKMGVFGKHVRGVSIHFYPSLAYLGHFRRSVNICGRSTTGSAYILSLVQYCITLSDS